MSIVLYVGEDASYNKDMKSTRGSDELVLVLDCHDCGTHNEPRRIQPLGWTANMNLAKETAIAVVSGGRRGSATVKLRWGSLTGEIAATYVRDHNGLVYERGSIS